MAITNKSDSPNVVVIGGGTGSYTILQELKRFTPYISAIVNMSDDGGSTGILRDEMGILPPGDLRRCFAALCESRQLREVMSYRFDSKSGNLEGHVAGNLFLATFEKVFGKEKGIRAANEVLRITGQVIPVSFDDHRLVMTDGGRLVRGQSNIDNYHYKTTSQNPTIHLEPKANINPEAKTAIKNADILVVAPGSLYGSLLAPLSVTGMKEAITKSPAKKVAITNLVTTIGQTDGWHAVDYVKKLEDVLGAGTFDFVLYNNRLPSAKLREKYKTEGEIVSFDKARFSEIRAKAIGDNFISGQTLIRHNARKVCRHLIEIFQSTI